MFRVGIFRSRSTFAPLSSTMTSGSPDNQLDSSSRNLPSAASTSPEPGTFHFGVSVQGWSDATSDWVV